MSKFFKSVLSPYWLCQIVGWLSMVLIEIVNYTFFIVGKFMQDILYIFIGCAAVGLLLTHLYKRLIVRYKILNASLSYVWIYAFVSTFVIAFFITIATEIPILIYRKQMETAFTFISIAGSTVNWMRYVGVWIIIYFMYKILQQHSAVQSEKLVVENLARTTELELLKMQLNPHFLFNALNSIKALVIINPEQSRDAIVKLSELLRFTLQYGKDRFIPLRSELEQVRKYLELEQLRFGSRLQVFYQLSEAADLQLIPPAILLTLVENAVKHGVAKQIGVANIIITTAIEPYESLLITIANSGTYAEGKHEGIGLKHITKRLEEMYEGKTVFSIGQQDLLVSATLKLPIK